MSRFKWNKLDFNSNICYQLDDIDIDIFIYAVIYCKDGFYELHVWYDGMLDYLLNSAPKKTDFVLTVYKMPNRNLMKLYY